jgi:hypothetical protein
VTQLLSMLGIAVGINMLAWMLVFPIVALAVDATYYILMWIGKDDAYSTCDSSTDAIKKVIGCAVVPLYELEMLKSTVMGLSIMFELKSNAMNWWVAQKMALPEDDKKKMDKKMEGDMAEEETAEDAEDVAELHMKVAQAYVSLFNL